MTTTSSTTTALSAFVTAGDLTTALRYVTDAMAKRLPIAEQAGAMIVGHGEQITVSTFDYDVHAAERLDADGLAAGFALVSAAKLLELVRGLDKGANVALVGDDKRLQVSGDGVTYRLPLLDTENYARPWDLQPADGTTLVALDAAGVARVKDVSGAASRDVTMPALGAVRFEATAGALAVMATDRYRATRWTTSTPSTGDAISVPLAGVNLLTKHFAKTPGVDMKIHTMEGVYERVVRFDDGRRVLTVREQLGDYPKLRAVFPSTLPGEVLVTTAVLAKAVKQVGKALNRNVPLQLTYGPPGVMVCTPSRDDDDVQASAPVGGAWNGHGAARNAFQPGWLADALDWTGGEMTLIQPAEREHTPVLLTDPDRPDFTVLLMPVRFAG